MQKKKVLLLTGDCIIFNRASGKKNIDSEYKYFYLFFEKMSLNSKQEGQGSPVLLNLITR